MVISTIQNMRMNHIEANLDFEGTGLYKGCVYDTDSAMYKFGCDDDIDEIK